MTTHFIDTVSEFNSVLDRLQDGDRVELAPGNYGNIRLTERDFANGITITSSDPDDPAVITNKLFFSKVSGVTVENIDVIGNNLRDSGTDRVQIYSSHDVILRDMTIQGYIPDASEGADASTGPSRTKPIAGFGHDKGLSLRWSQDITIDHVEMKDLRLAMYMEYVQQSTLSNTDIHDVREGINLKDIKGLTVVDNHFHDLQEFSGDHVDMIQYWGVNSGWGIHDLTIADNLFHQPEGGDTQTIFGSLSGNDRVTATDFTITGNTILNAHPHGIRLGDVDGAVISDNVLLPNASSVGWGWNPSIRLVRSNDIEISDNVLIDNNKGSASGLTDAAMEKANIEESGNMLLSHSSSGPFYWGDLPELLGKDTELSDAGLILAMPDYAGAIQYVAEIPDPVEMDGLIVKAGTSARDTLRGGNAGNYLEGLGGNDRLYEWNGSDILEGGSGADTFFFNFRKGMVGEQHDLVLDLDFSEGDKIAMVGSYSEFDNTALADNWLITTNGGRGAHFNSIGDIEEAILSGALNYDAGTVGNLILRPNEAPDRLIEIATLTADDLFL